VTDLVAGFVAHVRLELRPHVREDPPHQIENRHLDLVAEVEGVPGERPVGRHRLGEDQVADRAVLDVEVVAHERAVRADHRPLPAVHRSDGARHQAIPVEVAGP
jgi:hypothetical protein